MSEPYMVWHAYEAPQPASSFERALEVAVATIKQHGGKKRNNVVITREDLRRPIIVAVLRGAHIREAKQ